MSSPDESRPDFVDGLLAVARPPVDDSLRRAVLARTTAVIHRRRRAKRSALAVALAACYLAGIATARPWRFSAQPVAGSTPTEDVVPEDAAGRALVASPSNPAATEREAKPGLLGPRHGPAALKPAGYDHIRRVADRYLFDEGDISLATRYYSRALKLASADQRAVSIDNDSWLLMALKQAQN